MSDGADTELVRVCVRAGFASRENLQPATLQLAAALPTFRRMFETVRPQIESAAEKLKHLRRFL